MECTLSLVSEDHKIGVYAYVPETGLLGSGQDRAIVPNKFKTWMQRWFAVAANTP